MRLTDEHRAQVEADLAVGFGKALSYVQRRVAERVRTAATTLTASADGNDPTVVVPLAATAAIDPAAVYDPAWWRRGYNRYVAKKVDGFYQTSTGHAVDELGVDVDSDDADLADGLDGLDETADLWGAGLGPFVEGQIRTGLAEGDSVDGLTSRLRTGDESWFGDGRSVLLAVVAAATTWNRATLAAGKAARAQGTSSTKTWTTVGDDHVRDSHAEMDGQSVDVADDFLVAGAFPAAGPHDERLPIEEVVGCRCVLELSSDGGNVTDETASVDDGDVTYETDGTEEDALVAGGLPALLGRFEWDEALHPRADDGRFGEGSGDSESSKDGGGGNATAMPAAVDDFLNPEYGWVENLGELAWGGQVGGDPKGAYMAGQVGYDGHPIVTDRAGVDKAVADGGLELFRGVVGDDRHSAADMAEDFRSGNYFFGGGGAVNGVYFSKAGDQAAAYAGEDGALLRGALAADARTVDIGELRSQRDALVAEFADARERAYEDGRGGSAEADRLRQIEANVTGDLSYLAMLRGYDAITHDVAHAGQAREREVVILNRSKMVVEQ